LIRQNFILDAVWIADSDGWIWRILEIIGAGAGALNGEKPVYGTFFGSNGDPVKTDQTLYLGLMISVAASRIRG
jgi:hypothetical protein